MPTILRAANTVLRRSAVAPRQNVQTIVRRHASTHPEHTNFPFSYDNKKTFAFKAIAYMGTGFLVPFIAIWWNWNKPGGIHNP
ncbi:hypothetical protein Hypma_014459 [Hypsizygus marmoreus]|uniref:Cytochrome c oxidase subunit 8, mitochondrial n=1 Tax=Hypsizygus marmoreus TaxID=39966 RepID=A0A369JES9_HYPMA|nr:hypothetical protein Hypma_014459 [Hypsizygus marmoreus]